MNQKQAIRAMRKLMDKLGLWGMDWPTICACYPGVPQAKSRLVKELS